MIHLPSTPHQKTVTVFISKRAMMQEEATLQLRPLQTHSHSLFFSVQFDTLLGVHIYTTYNLQLYCY